MTNGNEPSEADVVVVGAGLAGLVATAELADAGRRVVVLEQEPEASFGGQAWWPFGGLSLVDSPEQRRLRVHDSLELARQDWFGAAGFDRGEDHWPRRWAEAYLDFAAGEKRSWLRRQGVGSFPVVAWAERGGYTATGTATPSRAFDVAASAVVVTAGGIGGNHEFVRRNWPARLGPAPQRLLSGVPAHVDGRMLETAEAAGASVVNADPMWHHTEGVSNDSPVWDRRGIRILPGPSSLWLDATGARLPVPLLPGFDTLGTLAHIGRTGHEHTWFVATHKIVEKDFALSGSEQNPDLTGKDLRLLAGRVRAGVAPPVQAFLDRGEDFVVADTLADLVAGMNGITGGEPPVDLTTVEREVLARDREVGNRFTEDLQLTAIRGARNYLGDKLIRVARPHRLLDPKAGPLVAVRLSLLTRKTLDGLETDLSGRVLRPGGEPFPGLYAAGEVAGFGGGGMHGYRSLEGTFLGGCLFSGRVAGRAVAEAL